MSQRCSHNDERFVLLCSRLFSNLRFRADLTDSTIELSIIFASSAMNKSEILPSGSRSKSVSIRIHSINLLY
jgi:hypothetical protein